MKRGFCLIFALLGLLFLTFSCGGGGKHEAAFLCRLDSLVEADADSALRLMGQAQGEGLPRRDAMRLELLRAKAMNRADSLFTTDSLMLRVAEYYRRHGTPNDRMLSLYLLGCTYRDMGAAPRAIETWQRAVVEADTTRQDCDLSTLMRIHSQMNELYTRQRLPKYAQQEAERAEALCWKMGDTLSALFFERKVCEELFNEGHYNKCIQVTQGFYQKYLQMSLQNEAALVSIYCAKSFLELKDYTKAKKYLDIYESYCLSEKDHRKINGGLAPYYIYKGNYYLGIGNIDSAEYCFRQAMPEMHLLHNDVDVYYRLYHIYEQRQQLDSTLKYIYLYAFAKENELGKLKIQATADVKHLYDYNVEQKIAQKEREKVTERTRYIYLFLLIFLFILCITAYTWMLKLKKDLRMQRERQRLLEVTQDLNEARKQLEYLYDAKKQIEESQTEALNRLVCLEAEKSHLVQVHFEKENLFQETSHKLENLLSEQRKEVERLKVERATLQDTISAQEEEIRMYQTERQKWEQALAMGPSVERAQAVANSPVMTRFHNVINNFTKDSLTEQDWNNLQKLIESTYPHFTGTVNQNGFLEMKDYRLCMLVKAKFAIQEIDILMNWKSGYSSTVRRRLHKVIFGHEGGAPEFDRKISLIQ